jgi:hemolysin III
MRHIAAEAGSLGPAYPRYRRQEEIADRCVHLFGIGLGIGAALILVYLAAQRDDTRLILAIAIYALGLVAMLACSALYNLAPPSARKEQLRRFDHAAIFVMIAGSYTPFLLGRMGGAWGWGLLAFVWVTAAGGASLALAAPRRFERLQLAGYLLLGWSILVAREPLAASVPALAIWMLVTGGLLYSFGVLFHLWQRLAYHNAIWHGLVLAAAGCHYAAVLLGVVLPR